MSLHSQGWPKGKNAEKQERRKRRRFMFLGIDISKANFDAVLLDSTNAKPRHKAFPNTPVGFDRLQEWLGEQTVHACLEATGTYGDALARFLHDGGHLVSVVNPARIKAFAQTLMARAKTDKADAHLIARFCALHRPEPWSPLAAEASELQAWVRRLESLHEMRQMENNRLKAGLAASVQVSLQEHLDYLDAEIKKTEQRIKDHICQHPVLKSQRDLLVSIPGIADTTAAALLAEIVDVHQFAGSRQVAAFAGLVPRIRQSGSSVRGRACLSKVGSWRLRKALFYPAMVALRFNPVLQTLHTRLLAAGKNKKLIVGAAMRKLLQIAYGVLKSGKPFDANFDANVVLAIPAGA
jgi:transposase